jgi:hypothetical protein
MIFFYRYEAQGMPLMNENTNPFIYSNNKYKIVSVKTCKLNKKLKHELFLQRMLKYCAIFSRNSTTGDIEECLQKRLQDALKGQRIEIYYSSPDASFR